MKNNTISNTEITSYNTCAKQHDYAYNLSIEPKQTKDHFYRGEVGHSALQAYYFEMMQGSSPKTRLAAAIHVLNEEASRLLVEEPEDIDKINILSNLTKIIKEYHNFYQDDPFRVLAVEEEYSTPLFLGTDYMMRLDLLVEFTDGKYRGDLAVFDHKFIYNFKTTVELSMDGQIPKFVKTLKDNGFTISKGFFNQIRYRDDAKERFQRTRIPFTTTSLGNIWNEQKEAARRIQVSNESNVKPLRVLNPFICKNCIYSELCIAELSGSDTEQMIKANFKKRDRLFKDVEFSN